MERTTPLALGAMNFGKRTPAREAERIVDRALDRGITLFDTANAYADGDSERILGHALKGKRDRCQIATKVGFARSEGRSEGLSKQRIARAIDESLARLGTDYVDIYYLHVPDHETPIAETLDAIHALLDAKKILAWGVSNYASWQILEMNTIADNRGMPRPTMAQQLYNLLIRQLDIEYFKFTKAHPIHTTVYNPLGGGLLTGRHLFETEPSKGSRFDKNGLYLRRYWSGRMFQEIASFQRVASDAGLTLLQLAYGWLKTREGVDSVLVGPGSVEHLDDAFEAFQKELSSETIARVETVHLEFAGTDTSYVR